jgi:mannose-6-phosphate isomerase-like protein (cupin superfamily)
MINLKSALLAITSAALPLMALAQNQATRDAGGLGGRGERGVTVWAPKPDKAPYVAPNRPLVKLTDLLKKHARQEAWAETVVRDASGLTGRYIQMAPGETTKTQFYADCSMFFIVEAGQLKVTLSGQEPFIASKGFIVQAPARVQYVMETAGEAPALRFEVTHTRALPFYPESESPTPVKGYTYQKVTLQGAPGSYGAAKPYLDFQKEIVEGGGRSPGGFVRDGETAANITRAPGAPTPPPSQLGHFHDGTSEFWFIMEGDVEFQIEGVPFIRATQGDIVYAPAGRWHRSGHAGQQMDTRISIHPIGAAANALPPNGGGGD